MLVKHKMTANPITVTPTQTISEVLDLMATHDIHRLPVVDGNKLVGLVTQGVVQENSPSHLTTLSIHEMNYLLSKTKVKDIMIKKVFTVGPDALIEAAADLMQTQDIGCLPVVGENQVLLGIITIGDILDAFVDFFGYHEPGTRVVLEVKEDKVGTLAAVAEVFANADISISHFIVSAASTHEFVLRVAETDKKKVEKLLESAGYTVISVS
jgi:acetoin utilization protein AcuB